ncbi:hypothetical protein LDENG_00095940 [Lucifuga dentata]|nr:hypothetical protein LDENG_00095940 [Lucifuga dentata]
MNIEPICPGQPPSALLGFQRLGRLPESSAPPGFQRLGRPPESSAPPGFLGRPPKSYPLAWMVVGRRIYLRILHV